MRAGILRPSLTKWQVVDPLWPYQSAYCYADASPQTHVDPGGMHWGTGLLCVDSHQRYLKMVNECIALVNSEFKKELKNCNTIYEGEITSCSDPKILKDLGETEEECLRNAESNLVSCGATQRTNHQKLLDKCWSNPESMLDPHPRRKVRHAKR